MHQDHFWNLLAKHLCGEASPAEREELESLIKANPELSFAAQHVTDLWGLKGGEDMDAAEQAFKKQMLLIANQTDSSPEYVIQDEVDGQEKNKGRKKFWPLLITGIIVVSLLSVWVIKPGPSKYSERSIPQTAEYYTRPGSRTKLILPDSSVVWLNSGSKLTYTQPFGVINRTVTLSGEAFFNVVKRTEPFIIHTEGVQIKVLGTAFNVRSYTNEKKIETSLVIGRVEVTLDKRPEKKYVLAPNEKLTLNKEESSITSKKKGQHPLAILGSVAYLDSSTIVETSWIDNKLVFVDESFSDIASKMERWYGVTINFKNQKIKYERFTGVFEKETVWQALEALQLTASFHFTNKENTITITH
jgi:ferric-dicitrate binding protein FerR (iron transport regulator)